MGGTQVLFDILNTEAQDSRILHGIDREPVLRVIDAELAPLNVEDQFQLAIFQNVSILVPQHRNQYLAL